MVNTGKCAICSQQFAEDDLFPFEVIRPSIKENAVKKYPHLKDEDFICDEDLNELRLDHIEDLLKEDRGSFSTLEKEVLESFENEDFVADNINKKYERELSFGERMADKIAKFGGSWFFIITFLSFIVIWMAINIIYVMNEPFDPYPFILLNLFLSCLAALQAPVIMMSQNRHAEKDRLKFNDDYVTNLKAEIEIQQLHQKLDQFIKKQWDTLIEIQKTQIDLLKHKKSK
ncbi:MAG: hypothetical protein SP1CHLAM54_12130 [Chlamydiia bacterium]|nr:hypothetical protein [Chlamydiia bacterium]MCH9616111.1 hypothetical protein [Chlamydiia bacterium]MCH9629466.1 hypothetical protein [Chlamydiia bacterium]